MGGNLNRNPLMDRNQNFIMNDDGDKNIYGLLCNIHKMNKANVNNSNKENVNYSNKNISNNNKSTCFRKNTVSFS